MKTGVTLKVACGRHDDSLQEFADNSGWQETETSWERLIERDDIDMFDISSPTNTHKDIATSAARAGKHMLCEKPMGLNAGEAREMYSSSLHLVLVAAGTHHWVRAHIHPSGC